MFFTYPLDATTDNWISSTLLDSLRNALEALQLDHEPPEFHDLVPEAYKSEFRRGRKFAALYDALIDACRPLDTQQRELILASLTGQNQFPQLFEAITPSSSIADTFPTVHQAARDLFEYAFEKLSDLRTPGTAETVRAKYHRIVHAHLKNGCCPFCGLEIIEAPDPDLVDPDLDHYLAASRYPFAGANLRNLTAMGTACNRSYKGAQDILLDELDHRVDCLDPYGNEQVTLSLDGTDLLPGVGEGPAWVLAFDPNVRSQNWRRVFNLETRLRANILVKHYQPWLEQCVSYARRSNIDLTSRANAVKAVSEFKKTCEYETLPTIARLKTSFFDLIEAELNDPVAGDRMHNFVAALEAT